MNATIEPGWVAAEPSHDDARIFRRVSIEPGPPAITGTDAKLRLGIAAFYDAERLAGALREFVLLGLLPDDLWLFASDERDDARSALRRSLEACGSLFAQLSKEIVLDRLFPDAPAIFCTDSPVLHILMNAKTVMGKTCLSALFQGEVGDEIRAHIAKGAVMAFAKAETPRMQDQCVKVLLRHSLHTVHSEECYQII